MPFHNRGMSLRPVHRIKHVVDKQAGLVLGTANNTNLVLTVDAPVLANTEEVETGSKVNGVYLHIEGYATSAGALTNFYMALVKNPGGNLTLPAANTVGSSDDKRYVIHQEMVMFQKVNPSNPRTLFNGVIVIPRGYRRFGPNDRLVLVLLTPGCSADICLQCHYKEFR